MSMTLPHTVLLCCIQVAANSLLECNIEQQMQLRSWLGKADASAEDCADVSVRHDLHHLSAANQMVGRAPRASVQGAGRHGQGK